MQTAARQRAPESRRQVSRALLSRITDTQFWCRVGQIHTNCPSFVLISVMMIVAARSALTTTTSAKSASCCQRTWRPPPQQLWSHAATATQSAAPDISIARIVLHDHRYRTIRRSCRLVNDARMRHFRTAATRSNDAVSRACSCLDTASLRIVWSASCRAARDNYKDCKRHVGKP